MRKPFAFVVLFLLASLPAVGVPKAPPISVLTPLIERAKPKLNSSFIAPATVKLDPGSTAAVSGLPGSGEAVRAITVTAEPGQKAAIVCDFGREVVGYPVLMGSSFNGVRISVACGEFEAECDNPFQAVVSQQIERGGIRWATRDRRAFRYVKFTLESAGTMRIDRVQAEVSEYPVEHNGAFECSDAMLNTIWNVSRDTLRPCMQDFYEDGIKRDRVLSIGDLRVEALVNYYVFGDVSLARRALMQMAAIQLPDGPIPAVGPAQSSAGLSDYCAYYVMALADYYRYSGDADTVALLYPHVRKVMEWFKANSDETELFRHADRAEWRVFVDWDTSLEKNDRVMALEALYYRALTDAAELANVAGDKRGSKIWSDRAALLRNSINSLLWDEGQGAYVDCITDEGASKLIHRQPNALALLAGLPAPEMTDRISAAIMDPVKTPPVITPYMNFYVASALFEQGRAGSALDLIRSYWGGMIERGATSFWEKFDPAWETPYEDREMSYCHGWSTGPGHMLPAYVAGVRPARPGFDQALIAPDMAGLEWVKATVPTPRGKIVVDWKLDRGCPVGSIRLPVGCGGQVVLPVPPEGAVYVVGKKRIGHKPGAASVTFTLKPGDTYELSLVEVAKR